MIPLPGVPNTSPIDNGSGVMVCPVNFAGVDDSAPDEEPVEPTDCYILPLWWSVDYCFTPANNRIIACCPSAPNTTLADMYGSLEVWQVTGDYPPEAGTRIVVEESGVWSVSILSRADGKIDLFYYHKDHEGKLLHRVSETLGESFDEPRIYDLGFDGFPFLPGDPANTAGVPGLSGGLVGGNAFLVCHTRESKNLALILDGYYLQEDAEEEEDPEIFPGCYLAVAKLSADGLSWEFTGQKLLRGYVRDEPDQTVRAGGGQTDDMGPVREMYPMRDGSILLLPGMARLTEIDEEANYNLANLRGNVNLSGSLAYTSNVNDRVNQIAGNGNPAWLDTRLGIALIADRTFFVATPPEEPNFGRAGLGWSVRTRNPSTGLWTDYIGYPPLNTDTNWDPDIYRPNVWIKTMTWQVVTDSYLPWVHEGFLGSEVVELGYVNHIYRVKVNKAGIWEILRVNQSQQLEFAFCRALGADAVAVWEGK